MAATKYKTNNSIKRNLMNDGLPSTEIISALPYFSERHTKKQIIAFMRLNKMLLPARDLDSTAKERRAELLAAIYKKYHDAPLTPFQIKIPEELEDDLDGQSGFGLDYENLPYFRNDTPKIDILEYMSDLGIKIPIHRPEKSIDHNRAGLLAAIYNHFAKVKIKVK